MSSINGEEWKKQGIQGWVAREREIATTRKIIGYENKGHINTFLKIIYNQEMAHKHVRIYGKIGRKERCDHMRTGLANAPLHGGTCPPWLFAKMRALGASIIEAIVIEYGAQEVLRRLSDPVWFQSFGSVLGFDWHSSGLTTVVCGALKDGLHRSQGELGLFFVGGKGKASRRTPTEIMEAGEKYGLSNDLIQLQQTSRTVAKVDSAAVQDGYQLYHHFLVFDRDGNWAIIQQGMNEKNRYARRYHWLSEGIHDFTNDPHKAVCGTRENKVLNLVSRHNKRTRLASIDIFQENPETIQKIYHTIANRDKRHQTRVKQLSLFDEDQGEEFYQTNNKDGGKIPSIITMPVNHTIPSPKYFDKILYQLYEHPPESYQGLLEQKGVGPSTLRALAMVSEITHGAQPTFNDPVRYAFAHGGKDCHPFPVRKHDMDHSLSILKTAIEKGKIGEKDKLESLRKLAKQQDNNPQN